MNLQIKWDGCGLGHDMPKFRNLFLDLITKNQLVHASSLNPVVESRKPKNIPCDRNAALSSLIFYQAS
jgi:hypothetical protein